MYLIKSHNIIRLLLSCTFIVSSIVNAADIEAGKEKVAHCTSCHGANGNSKNSQFPKLAGQKGSYLEAQLKNFQSGQRTNPVMQGMTAHLSKEDIKNISVFFASVATESAGGDPALAKKGEPKTAMCKGCHGATLNGMGSTPKLAGQHPDYIKNQLLNFKFKIRKGGPMNAVTSSLSEQDINEIAAYLGSL